MKMGIITPPPGAWPDNHPGRLSIFKHIQKYKNNLKKKPYNWLIAHRITK
jgi:hypothetical protein